MWRSKTDVREMLEKVDKLREQEAFEDDHNLDIIQHVLLWIVDDYNPDNYIEDYFPEENN